MLVEKLMTKSVKCCQPSDTLEQAARLMWDCDCGCLPVCGGDGVNKVSGMITDRDITMCMLFEGKPLCELSVGAAMSRSVRTCKASDSLADAERIMREGKIRRLPVTDDNDCIVGVISLADLAEEAIRERGAKIKQITEGEIRDTLAAICTPFEPEAAA